MKERALPAQEPVRRTITVGWNVEAAFRRFTAQMAAWWPLRTHSVGGLAALRCVFEEKVGGKIYEVARDGSRCEWGTVLLWEPPHRVAFTWHPGHDASRATRVELRFTAVAAGTRLDLTHSGWEVLGDEAAKARKGYRFGWLVVLHIWADRRRAPVVLLSNAILFVADPLVRRLRRARAARARAAHSGVD
jgi:uncharacterized protein YndB with AHSA1/START domain